MKSLLALLFLLFTFSASPQTTTYSKEEERMVLYVNNGLAYAIKYDSLQNVKPVIDSCWKFLKKYPNSFAKPNIFSYLLEMTVVITNDVKKINPLIDSVLIYDKLASTRLRIGEILIERNLDIQKGRDFIIDSFPELTVDFHKYRAHMLMSRSDIILGNYATARMHFEKALEIESTSAEAWYEYLSFLKMRELHNEANIVLTKINELDKQSKLRYVNQTNISANINKSIYKLSLFDLDSNVVELKSFKGEVVVINRFNFWCGYCVYEFPTLKKMIREFPEVKFIFINSGETAAELRDRYFSMKEFSFLKEQIVLFMNSEYYNEIYTTGVPHTLVVDKSGNVRFDYIGYRKELETLLRENLKRLLKSD